MGLKNNELVQELSEAFATFDGRGRQEWQAYAYEACRYILAHDLIIEAAKRDGQHPPRLGLKVVSREKR